MLVSVIMVHPVGVHREIENGLVLETHKFGFRSTLGVLKITDHSSNHSNLQLRCVFSRFYSGKFSWMSWDELLFLTSSPVLRAPAKVLPQLQVYGPPLLKPLVVNE